MAIMLSFWQSSWHFVDMTILNPDHNCDLCPRLKAFIDDNRIKFPDKFNGPVPSFGPEEAELLIVGLAPGLKGANFSGRPFTGDYAGDLLYGTLLRYGFAKGEFKARADDGLELINCRITNAVRCVPPENKPTGPEINECRPFLNSQFDHMPNLKVIFSLGLVSHNTVVKASGDKLSAHKFGHNQTHTLQNGLTLVDSYHCSRYNTNTGRLTEAMFHDAFETAISLLD